MRSLPFILIALVVLLSGCPAPRAHVSGDTVTLPANCSYLELEHAKPAERQFVRLGVDYPPEWPSAFNLPMDVFVLDPPIETRFDPLGGKGCGVKIVGVYKGTPDELLDFIRETARVQVWAVTSDIYIPEMQVGSYMQPGIYSIQCERWGANSERDRHMIDANGVYNSSWAPKHNLGVSVVEHRNMDGWVYFGCMYQYRMDPRHYAH